MEQLQEYLTYEPLAPLAATAGLNVDEVNYVVCMLLSYPLASVFRLLPTSSPTLRHLYGIFVGLAFGIFCFRLFVLHTIVSSLIVFIMLKVFGNVPGIHKVIFVFVMGYMVACHLYRQIYSYGAYILDVTGPQMLLTQKLTFLAFSVYDGRRKAKGDAKLNDLQQEYATTTAPGLLEFFGHVFFFPGYLAGPAHFLADYKTFIEGTDKNGAPPSSFGVCIKKILGAFVCIGITKLPAALGFELSLYVLERPEFHRSNNFFFTLVFLWASSVLVRMKYYFAWILADGANNAAGFGFNGYTKNGVAKWDKITNVNVFQVEFATSLKSVLDNWNMQTQKWLRYVMYDRTQSVYLTMFLSAIWHGLYPGYFLTFISAAIHTEASRKVRNTIRPLFLNSVGQKVYDVITFLMTCVCLNYLTLPFVLLSFWRSVDVWTNIFFIGHLIAIPCLFLPGKSKSAAGKPAAAAAPATAAKKSE